ncbi:hypothetical protein NDU88_003777 [Pleurodeles waltl]|uniref:Uncharacterized protein n=1 Tax=Pleurodeles waltl TaxID=8319 RepID=A0AAV7MSL7_PLEWA|nr:hypothetical protein NDU88_003777 [Pleurodeles waltl]
MEGKIGELKVHLALIRQDLRNTMHKVTEVDSRVSETEDVVTLHDSPHNRTSIGGTIGDPGEDAKGKSRHNNLRLVGIPERAEGTMPTPFISNWLQRSPLALLLEAHSALTARPPVGAPPRPFIALALKYTDTVAILRAARKKGSLTF